MGKAGSVLLSLFVALVFGGVGVFASWAIGSTLLEAHRAQDWVRVKAAIDEASLQTSRGSEGGTTYRAEGRYRYTFQGKPYAGSRLGLSKVGGSDNIDDWHHEVNARLEDARAAGKPITVWVNPDNPSESVFDRELRWSELVFLVPFALAFGGVGVGALVAMVFVLRAKGEGGARQSVEKAMSGQRAADGAQGNAGAGFLWVFAFFWNSLSFPIAFLVVRDVVDNGEWAGLFVLLFPLVGVGLLWAAVSATWNAWLARRGAGDANVRARPAASAPGRFAAQAARAMFDPKGGAALRPSVHREVAIPPSVAEVEGRGGTLTIRYVRRRVLGPALIVFVVGAIFACIGIAMAASDAIGMAAVVVLLVGTLVDAWAVSMLVGALEVRVKGEELAVDKRGLFGSRSWRVRRDAVSAIRASVSYTVNGQPYFAVFAEGSGERIPLGDSLKGPELADAVAQRVARALGVSSSIVVEAGAQTSPSAS